MVYSTLVSQLSTTSFSLLSQLSPLSTVSPISYFTVSGLYMLAEPKKRLEPQIEHSNLKTSNAVSQLSPNIFLTTFLNCLLSLLSLLSHISLSQVCT